MTLRVGVSIGKSTLCLVWCPRVLCKWRYIIFNWSNDLTKAGDWRIMELYEWEFLMVCHLCLLNLTLFSLALFSGVADFVNTFFSKRWSTIFESEDHLPLSFCISLATTNVHFLGVWTLIRINITLSKTIISKPSKTSHLAVFEYIVFHKPLFI